MFAKYAVRVLHSTLVLGGGKNPRTCIHAIGDDVVLEFRIYAKRDKYDQNNVLGH